jgi:hypothetical protein
MGSTWASLLSELVAVRNREYRSEPERKEVQIETLEYIVQTMLEKLRDEEQLP